MEPRPRGLQVGVEPALRSWRAGPRSSRCLCASERRASNVAATAQKRRSGKAPPTPPLPVERRWRDAVLSVQPGQQLCGGRVSRRQRVRLESLHRKPGDPPPRGAPVSGRVLSCQDVTCIMSHCFLSPSARPSTPCPGLCPESTWSAWTRAGGPSSGATSELQDPAHLPVGEGLHALIG